MSSTFIFAQLSNKSPSEDNFCHWQPLTLLLLKVKC